MSENFTAFETIQPAESTKKYRRIVTGFDQEGNDVVVEDQFCPNRYVLGGLDTLITTEFWRMDTTPDSNDGPYVDKGAIYEMNPSPSGNVFRIVEFPPLSSYAPADTPPDAHRTASLDYAVVLEGECDALVGDKEIPVKAGDVVIQRGTLHAWTNRSDAPCRILFVLCGANEIPGKPVL